MKNDQQNIKLIPKTHGKWEFIATYEKRIIKINQSGYQENENVSEPD